jgi:hypothetical protein
MLPLLAFLPMEPVDLLMGGCVPQVIAVASTDSAATHLIIAVLAALKDLVNAVLYQAQVLYRLRPQRRQAAPRYTLLPPASRPTVPVGQRTAACARRVIAAVSMDSVETPLISAGRDVSKVSDNVVV